MLLVGVLGIGDARRQTLGELQRLSQDISSDERAERDAWIVRAGCDAPRRVALLEPESGGNSLRGALHHARLRARVHASRLIFVF